LAPTYTVPKRQLSWESPLRRRELVSWRLRKF
jgi:hypothetical protein